MSGARQIFIYLLQLVFVVCLQNAQATIYGENDFKDIYQLENQVIQHLSESVAVLVRNKSITKDLFFRSKSLLQASVCESENFVDQPVTSFCTGTLISPKHILTASHCYKGIDSICESASWVFDYKYKYSQNEDLVADPEKTYSCLQIVGQHYLNNLDHLVVELDRPVQGIEPVEVDFAPISNEKKDFYAITAPRGLPLKYSKGELRSNTNINHIVTNIDLMRGSSGGPVFDSETHKLVGVVAQGDLDYELQDEPFCNRFKRCDADKCRGEYATRLSQLTYLKEIIQSGYDNLVLSAL